jgi:WD40 repeat protein
LEKLNENKIVSFSDEGWIKVWDVQIGTCLQTWNGCDDSGGVNCIKVLPNNFLASGSGRLIKIWSLQDGSLVKTLVGHTDEVLCLIVLSNGCLLSGSEDMTIKVWDIEQSNCTQTLLGHTEPVNCLLSLSNGHLASGSREDTIKIWDMETGQCLKTEIGHSSDLLQINVDEIISSSGEIIIVRSLDTELGHEMYDDDHGRILHMIICQSDKLVVTSCSNNFVKVWDTVTKQCIRTIKTDHEEKSTWGLILF